MVEKRNDQIHTEGAKQIQEMASNDCITDMPDSITLPTHSIAFFEVLNCLWGFPSLRNMSLYILQYRLLNITFQTPS